MHAVDVLIVGGGPAGAAAAIRAKQLDSRRRVVVLDKAAFPRDKPCGDGLGPHAVAEIVHLGAAHVFTDRVPVHTVRLVSPSGTEVVGVPPKPGYVIPRRELDAGLIFHAAALGVEVVTERLDTVEVVGTGAREHVVVNGQWACPWLIAADGVNSRTRRLIEPAPMPAQHTAIAVRGYAPCDHEHFTIAWQTRNWPAYAWEFPIGDGTANVGYGYLVSSRPDRRSDRVELWDALSATVDLIADPSTLRAHHLVASSAGRSLTSRRVLFCGDAAGMINPLSGEGIFYALAAGRIAAASLGAADPARAYRTGVAREFRAHFRATRWAHRFQRLTPRVVDAGVAAAGRSPATMARLTELAIGRGTLFGR